MSYLFHPSVPYDYISKIVYLILCAYWHTYQILTKRSRRMCELLKSRLNNAAKTAHIWWGVSVENRKHSLPRIDDLRKSGAQIKFLSCEPLLEDLVKMNLCAINWVIVGGESGPGARPMSKQWVLKYENSADRVMSRFSSSNGAVFKKVVSV